MNSRRLLIVLCLVVWGCSCQSTNGKHEAPEPQPTSTLKVEAPENTTPSPSVDTGVEVAKLTKLEQEREKVLGVVLSTMLKSQHLLQKDMQDEMSKNAFKEYIEILDPAKGFLLQSDVEKLRSFETAIDDELKMGTFTLAHHGSALLDKRVKDVSADVSAMLDAPFDFTKDESLETDPEKRTFAKSVGERRERWRKILKYQTLQRVKLIKEKDKARAEIEGAKAKTKPKPYKDAPFAELEKRARKQLKDDYSARFARTSQDGHIEQVELFLNAITHVYDPHTAYLAPARKENFDISMSGSLEGIGAVLSVDQHYVKIVRIVPGSASWRQGDLEASDIILEVTQEGKEPVDVVDMRLDDVVRQIRGPKGSVVTLTVKKPDGRIITVPITRDVVKIEEAYARGAILKHPKLAKRVGYIDLPSFYGNTRVMPGSTPARNSTGDVRALLEAFVKQGVDQVILDLRGNGGGLLNDARLMSGLFFKTGPVVQVRAGDGRRQVLADRDPGVTFDGRVVVLVDRFSASASEIVAGALQDYKRAVIVGTSQTHGKGTVQVILGIDDFASASPMGNELKPLGVVKLTAQQFFRVTGSSTQHKGIVPDVLLPDPAGYIESGERYLDYSIKWSSAEEAPFQPWPKEPDVESLVQKSTERVLKNPGFKRVEDRTAYLKKRREQSVEPLKKDAWDAKEKRIEKELESLTVEEKDRPTRFQVTEVKYGPDQNKPKPKPTTRKGRKVSEGKDLDWTKLLGKDIWLEEALFILNDMK